MPAEVRKLRAVLRQRALKWARENGLPYYESLATKDPVVLFQESGSRHGNFLDQVYDVAAVEHRERLKKPHPRKGALPTTYRDAARELDSSTSSDALLMNVLCFPDLGGRVCSVLGLNAWCKPSFGERYRVNGEPAQRLGWTELDVSFENEGRIDLSIEAKLTEQDFKLGPLSKVQRYLRLGDVFDADALPRKNGQFESYQLIRNVLAADQHGGGFLLLYDRRRPDLLARWDRTAAAIRIPALRSRCSARTWQDIAEAAPDDLRRFLSEKYGIE